MQDNLYLVMHEIFHALGFNPDLFPSFINPITGAKIPAKQTS
jgi:hypothetical protein